MASFDPYPKFTPVLRPMIVGHASAPNDEVKRMAGNAFVAGLVGIFVFGIILGPYAIFTGNRTLRLINSTGTGKQHEGMARSGVIIGSIAFILHLIGAVLVIAAISGSGLLMFSLWSSPAAKLVGAWEIDVASQMTPAQRNNPMSALMSSLIEVNMEFGANGTLRVNAKAFGEERSSQGSWKYKKMLGPELVLDVESEPEGSMEFYVQFNNDNEITIRGMKAPGQWDNRTLTLKRKKN